MLSREDEEARHIDEGVFEGGFDDVPDTLMSSRVRPVPAKPLSSRHPPSSHRHTSVRQYPHITLPTSNDKV